ncbi:hypothetical protein ACFROC_35775 [Nocardia tengchongensis]|uniref:hypothetical protein n=1 Tax=Nocardia tengchongensis TaxID=2055889 RepID=UPI00367DFECF
MARVPEHTFPLSPAQLGMFYAQQLDPGFRCRRPSCGETDSGRLQQFGRPFGGEVVAAYVSR